MMDKKLMKKKLVIFRTNLVKDEKIAKFQGKKS
jgi:hypothetical protein